MRRQARAAIALLLMSIWAASSSKITSRSARSVPATGTPAKDYSRVFGNGWCAGADSTKDDFARHYVGVACDAAKERCNADTACVAYACYHHATTPKSVIYSSKDCSHNCTRTDWLHQRRLITRAVNDGGSDSGWVNATCHVAAKLYTEVPGHGWCAGAGALAGGYESRHYVSIDCTGAAERCDADDKCVAFACYHAATSPVSVIYSSSHCTDNCTNTSFIDNPQLINHATDLGSQGGWSTATCHVAYGSLGPPSLSAAVDAIECTSTGYLNSSTALYSDAWTLRKGSTSALTCEALCTGNCVAWKANSSNWAECYTTNKFSRTANAWPQGYTGFLKCASADDQCPFIISKTSLVDPPGTAGSPWVLLPAKSREDCAAQCRFDRTCVAYKGSKDSGCLLTPNVRCTDFTCYLTPNYANSTTGWEQDGPDWAGAFKTC